MLAAPGVLPAAGGRARPSAAPMPRCRAAPAQALLRSTARYPPPPDRGQQPWRGVTWPPLPAAVGRAAILRRRPLRLAPWGSIVRSLRCAGGGGVTGAPAREEACRRPMPPAAACAWHRVHTLQRRGRVHLANARPGACSARAGARPGPVTQHAVTIRCRRPRPDQMSRQQSVQRTACLHPYRRRSSGLLTAATDRDRAPGQHGARRRAAGAAQVCHL